MKSHSKIIFTLLLLLAGVGVLSASQIAPAYGARADILPATPPHGSTAYYDLNIRQCFKQGDWNGGKQLLDEAIKKYPQMSAFHELMGRYYIHLAQNEVGGKEQVIPNYDKARYYLIRSINIDEKNVQSRYYMLQVETATRHFSSAIVYCNDLLEENPYNEDLWLKKIDLYRQLGDNVEADRLLERLYTIYPNDEEVKKALVYRKQEQALRQGKEGDYYGQEQTLRKLLEYGSKDPDSYAALIGLLYRTGRLSEAASVAAEAATATSLPIFVEKHASILCEMNRHREAIEYVRSYVKRTNHPLLVKLLHDMEMEEARAAQYNDAYIAYAKIYDSNHSIEALDYLVNTSIERWYLDDAAYYVEESLKRKGESQKMLYNQYLVHKRLGNDRKAHALLEKLYERYPSDETVAEEMMLLLLDNAKELMDMGQYAEAAPLLEKVYYSEAYPYLREAAFQRLYNCYFQTKQFLKAEKMLSRVDGVKRVTQTAALYSAWNKPQQALEFLSKAYNDTPETEIDTRNLIAYTYEELSLPYIRSLLSSGRVAEASKQIAVAMDICTDKTDLLRYAISAAQRQRDIDALVKYVGMGLDLYPEDPFFRLKDAQLRYLAGDHKASLEEIEPLLKEYAGDSLLIALYVESTVDIANDYLRDHRPDDALDVIQSALKVAPESSELYLVQGRAYEKKKEWKLAFESYQKYKPGYVDLAEHKTRLELSSHHLLRNALSLEFQLARPSSEDVLSGNAYVNYSHLFGKRSTLDVGLSYAGRDGAVNTKDTEVTKGGTGVQLSAGFAYRFCPLFTGKAEIAVATRYFPVLMGRLSGTFDLPRDWQLSFFASYRRLRSYGGIYGWRSEVVGYSEGKPVFGEPEYVRVGWHETMRSMFQVGVGANKTLNRFELGGELSGMYFASQLYFNTNVKMRFYPKEGNTSNLFAVAGLGTAPESSLIDRSMPVGFSKLNTFVGLGGSYFVNRWLTFTLSGTWYTMLAQSERLSTTYIANDPYIREDYRNYYYLHGAVLISF